MKLTRLGSTGLKVSRMCMGTMTFGTQTAEPDAFTILDACAQAGVNFIDVADNYPLGSEGEVRGETERIVGRWLKGRRHNFILATKGSSPMGPLPWDSGNSRKHLLDAIDASLKRLDTDYVDLYQLHRDDPDTSIDETLEALDTIVKSGRARYVGVSNWTAWRLARALGRSEALGVVKIATAQPRYNLLFRQFERDLFPLCQEDGIGTLCYNPLAGGLLTGKHRDLNAPDASGRFGQGGAAKMYKERYWHEREFEAIGKLSKIADEAGIPLLRLSLAWVMAQPGVTCAILGASKLAQMPELFAANEVKLDAALLAKLDEATHEFRMGDASR
ncbi:aldo/keto reductase [Caenimonas aquaedulcis]|uniref:Aldo/keto reductase n=1 Tax=Caenimonas aquaedulcis TaxID=2793270 RepID=A0A931MFL6_9BURK|nr:aldo/keto reductase [Caenimonas aquaedulcis]MBG9387378.1 aldo/keto reductase [Caenimonas aquaedulcis]